MRDVWTREKQGPGMAEKKASAADIWRLAAIIVVTGLITILFVSMVAPFLKALALAAIVAAMSQGAYRFFYDHLGARSHLAAGCTLIFLLIIVIGPIVTVLYVAAAQAAGLAESLRALANEVQQAAESGGKITVPDWVPFQSQVDNWLESAIGKAEEIAQSLAGFFVSSVSDLTRGAVAFFLQLFIFLYALFFFLQFDEPILNQILRFSGLAADARDRVVARVDAVSRATLKGTLTIAVIQGSLGGVGFFVLGIPSVAFWTVLMIIMAMIPAVGAPMVMFGGVIYLLIESQPVAAGLLAVWAFVVVASIDNILRPQLVGRDAGMPDLMILISTLGGLGYFGAPGLILGPVLAGVFMTVWQELSETIARNGKERDGASDVADTA
jgi:predicted PurR-regulated permease PerM